MKVKPLGDRVLVKVEMMEEKTKGGIYIPDSKKEKTQYGKVVEVGTDKSLKEMGLEKGKKVLFEKYSGTDVTIDAEEYLVLKKPNILAIIEE